MTTKSRDDKNDGKSQPAEGGAPDENEPWTGDWNVNVEVRKALEEHNVEDKRNRR